MNVSLEWYKIFYEVAKKRNITEAAQSLCISQPAVSQTIKQLEESLHADLFLRTKKGVTLTKEGEVLYSYISEAMEKIKLGEAKVAEQVNLESGEIRIGSSDMCLQFFLLKYIRRASNLGAFLLFQQVIPTFASKSCFREISTIKKCKFIRSIFGLIYVLYCHNSQFIFIYLITILKYLIQCGKITTSKRGMYL